ncbi:MAG: RimK family alpha-L-glutamate ligase [Ruminococcaceae bacterium]|nr:RimK family alpha-L-glutamate ligase [Oscillospiraceae bacterium]
MKNGWLIINHFLQSDKFEEHYEWLQEAAEQIGFTLKIKTGCDLMQSIDGGMVNQEPLPDFGLFWDKDIRLAMALERKGLRLFNAARAVALCDDKSLTHLTLAGHIPMPQTICAPMTYPNVGYPDMNFVKEAGDVLGWPMVIKECFGSFGGQVYLVHDIKEAEDRVISLAGRAFLFQQFVEESRSCDVRLQVVGNQVVAAMKRYNTTGDFRANITAGGNMEFYEPTEQEKEMALLACQRLGLDFAGVDFLHGPGGTPLLCEVNSNAHFKNLYTCTGVNVAETILSYVAESLKKVNRSM